MKSVKGEFKKPEAVTADSMRRRATDADVGGTMYSGRRCTRCNGWIANEALHHCSDTAVSDVRIANALERIAVALERASAAQPVVERPSLADLAARLQACGLLSREVAGCLGVSRDGSDGDCTTRAA